MSLEQIQLRFVPDRGWQEVQWTLSSVYQSPLPAGFLAGFSVAWVGWKQMFEQRINGLAEMLQLEWASRYSQWVSQLAGVLLSSQQRNCSLQLRRWWRGKCTGVTGKFRHYSRLNVSPNGECYIWQQIHYSRTLKTKPKHKVMALFSEASTKGWNQSSHKRLQKG